MREPSMYARMHKVSRPVWLLDNQLLTLTLFLFTALASTRAVVQLDWIAYVSYIKQLILGTLAQLWGSQSQNWIAHHDFFILAKLLD